MRQAQPSSTPGAPTIPTAGTRSRPASCGVASTTPSTWSCSGPTRWLTGFYLGALEGRRAEMADALGEPDAAADATARDPRARPRAGSTSNLFNGEYFVQRDRPRRPRRSSRPFVASERAAGRARRRRRGTSTGAPSTSSSSTSWATAASSTRCSASGTPACTASATCSTASRSRPALRAIYRHNFTSSGWGTSYNPCRVFGLDDESGTVIASWPDPTRKPAVPVPYAQETMHGMEYAFGQMLMAYGMLDEGVRVTAAVRDRYDGAQAQPLERDRVRLELRALDGELGGGRRAAGLRVRCRAPVSSASHPRVRDGDASRSLLVRPAGVRHRSSCATGGITLDVLGGDDGTRAGSACRSGGEPPTAVRVDGRSSRGSRSRATGELVLDGGRTLVGRRARSRSTGLAIDARRASSSVATPSTSEAAPSPAGRWRRRR